MTNNPFTEWEEGNLSAYRALRALCMDLGEVESELAPLQKQRDDTRNQIGDILLTQDNYKAEIKDFGRLMITAPSISAKYDTKAVDALVSWLVDAGYTDIAERLAACKIKSMRAGGLRIEREREREQAA